VRALAAADGVVLPKVSTGSNAWRDRAIIAGVGLLVLLVLFVPARWFRRGRARAYPEPD
jgi:hypothetical protein